MQGDRLPVVDECLRCLSCSRSTQRLTSVSLLSEYSRKFSLECSRRSAMGNLGLPGSLASTAHCSVFIGAVGRSANAELPINRSIYCSRLGEILFSKYRSPNSFVTVSCISPRLQHLSEFQFDLSLEIYCHLELSTSGLPLSTAEVSINFWFP